MYTLSTHIELPIAHRLPGAYSGLCVGNVGRNEKDVFPKDNFGTAHGHNYFITFKVSTDKMNEDFMVMDFKKIKKLIHTEMDQYDHSLILKEGDALIDFYKKGYEERGIDFEKTRIFVWKQAPTAEYMAYIWFNTFKKIFAENGIELSHLAITVEETSHNSVTYEEDIEVVEKPSKPKQRKSESKKTDVTVVSNGILEVSGSFDDLSLSADSEKDSEEDSDEEYVDANEVIKLTDSQMKYLGFAERTKKFTGDDLKIIRRLLKSAPVDTSSDMVKHWLDVIKRVEDFVQSGHIVDELFVSKK